MKKNVILLCVIMLLLTGCSGKKQDEVPTAIDTVVQYTEASIEESEETEESSTESYEDELEKYKELLMNTASVDNLLKKGPYMLSISSIDGTSTEPKMTCYVTTECAGYIKTGGFMRVSKLGTIAEYNPVDSSYTAIVNAGGDDLFYDDYNKSWCGEYLLGEYPIIDDYKLIDDCLVEIYYYYGYVESISMKALIDTSCNQLMSITTLFDGMAISECVIEPLDEFPEELTKLYSAVYDNENSCTVTCNYVGGTFTVPMTYDIGKGCKILPYVDLQYDYAGYIDESLNEHFDYSNPIYRDINIYYKENQNE